MSKHIKICTEVIVCPLNNKFKNNFGVHVFLSGCTRSPHKYIQSSNKHSFLYHNISPSYGAPEGNRGGGGYSAQCISGSVWQQGNNNTRAPTAMKEVSRIVQYLIITPTIFILNKHIKSSHTYDCI